MSRSGSEIGRSAAVPGPSGPSPGLSLLEISVALAVSGLLVGALAMFFKNFSHTFNLQEQVADRDLNAHYTVKRLGEVLMSAGANLPATGWNVVSLPDGNGSSRLRLAVNPRGGIQYLSGPVSGSELPVDDAKGFAKAKAVLVVPQDALKNPFKAGIDEDYSGDGFSAGFKPAGSGCVIRLSSAVNLAPGDVVYAYDEEEYRLEGTNLMLGDMVLAENIESLRLTFLTAAQAPTLQWSAMRSARLELTARTRLPDPRMAGDGGYRKIELSTDVLLRNRI